MTILCDTDLLFLMRGGLIQDPDFDLINPASIDIRVGTKIVLEDNSDDIKNAGMTKYGSMPSGSYSGRYQNSEGVSAAKD